MKLSTRTHYLVQVLLDLELHYKGDSPVPLRDIAQRQNMSQAYLEQMMTHLVAGGLVRSVRGPKGGIVLTKSAKEINLKEIVELLEGPTDLVECLVNAKICPRSKLCAVRDIWYEMKIAMDHVLASTTLHDLAERQRDKGTKENIYSI